MNKTWILASVLALPLLTAIPSRAAAFIKFDGIDGESVDRDHKGAIDIQSFSWGVSNAGAVSGGGGGAGKASFQDFHFTTRLNKTSPLLALACASGQHIKSAKLYVRKAGSDGPDYYEITLEEVMVSSVSVGGGASDEAPTESLSLNFTKISWKYVPQSADGSVAEPVIAGWDLATNTRL